MSIILNEHTPDPPPASLAATNATNEFSETNLLAFVAARRQASMQYYQGIYAQIQSWYNAFVGVVQSDTATFRNNLALPMVFSVIMSDVAKKANVIFSSWPYVSFRGFQPGSEASAHKCEQLVSAQLLDCQSFRKAVDFFTCADLYGTAVAQVGWSHIERMHKIRQNFGGKFMEVEQPVIEFDGPDWENCDILQCWPEAGKKHIQEMSHFMRGYHKDLDYLFDLDRSVRDPATGMGLFITGALDRVKAMGPASGAGTTSSFIFPRMAPYMPPQIDKRYNDPYAKPVEIWEYWGDVPAEFAPDGIRRRAITIANGKVILRNDPLNHVFWHNRLPFITYSPMPDPHYFFGMAKARIAEPLQNAAGRLSNQKLDALDLAINPMWFMNMQALSGNQNLYTKPGRVFPVRGNPNEVVMPVVPNLQGIDLSYNEIESLWRYIQQATGISEDTVMGMQGNQRQTAREYLGRQESVLTRLNLEAMLASSEFVEPLAEMFRDLNKQYLPLPSQMKILGQGALLDRVTGLPLPMEDYEITEGVINQDWRARATGPLMMLTKTMQQQNAMQLLQVMSANPVMLQATNWVNFARRIYELFDWPSDDMLVQAIPGVNQLANQLNASPEQLLEASNNPALMFGGAGGQSLSPVSPDQLGNQPQAPLGMGA